MFVAAWGNRPINESTTDDVLEIIAAKKRTAPAMARTLLSIVKRFFNWAIDQRQYGLDRSPCDRLKASRIIGEERSRTRRLSDAELFAFWRAMGRMKYPEGPVYRLLSLTGLRLNEVARLSWPEVHGDVLIIPAERMKGKDGKAREHLAPLSKAACQGDRSGTARSERAIPVLA
jgi:integrase